MLSFPPAVRIWLALAPADLRKGFDALAELVRQHLRDDPLSGHVFVFRNRRSDRIKLLYWDTDGFVIVYKRLETGTFRFAAVVLFSFTSTCQRLGVEPWAYLHDVLSRLPTTPAEQLGDLLPDRWQAAREAKMATPAAPATEPTTSSAESAS